MDWLLKQNTPMGESFFIKRKRIATELTEAQSYAVNYGGGLIIYRYRTDEKTIELPLTANFLRFPNSKVRGYLDHCVKYFLAK